MIQEQEQQSMLLFLLSVWWCQPFSGCLLF